MAEEGIMRPQPRPEIQLTLDDIKKMERVVWGEARGETPEGRNAIRGVILNRLASGRFGDTLEDVLTADQFDTIRDHGNGRIDDIPVPDEAMDMLVSEASDYLMLGKDASDGRTFYQNEETATGRYEGVDPMRVGNHTFYRGLKGQEPVHDTNFSHNIRLVPSEEDMQMAGMATGGLVRSEATKGIRTREGMEMAMNKFQLDRSKADQDGDGEVSKLEEIQGEAAQRTVGKDDLVEMACGGIMMPDMEIDPVSGNEVPLGSTPENVRDDIPAMLSQDEYVLPAHVVKWHGLKHIQEMQMEAEAGLMSMAMEGLIGGMDMEEAAEEADEEDTVEDEYVEDMDVEVDVPTVEVEDELEGEEYEEEPQTSTLPGMMKKQKYAFIIS